MWYYQVGGRALGPVPWSEIETLVEDTFDAEELLVARAGDDEWRPASEVIDEFDDREVEYSGGKRLTPLEPVHGLKAWLAQAWSIITDSPWNFVSAGVLVICISSFSLLICFPAMHAGLYLMAFKRYRGKEPMGGDVVGGFQHFGKAFGLYLLIFLIGLPFGVATLLLMVAVMIVLGAEGGASLLGMFSTWVFWLAVGLGMSLPGAMAFFAMPLMLDREMGIREALSESWALTRRDYFSYLGMTIVLSVLSVLGGLLCWIGLVITLPILPAAQVCAYKHYFDDEARSRG